MKSYTSLLTLLWFIAITAIPTITNAQNGEELFTGNCASCHFADDRKLVGPGLAGATERRTQEWLINWTRDSQGLIASGDEEANQIFTEYNNMPMLPFPNLTDEEIIAIFDYVDAAGSEEVATTGGGSAETVDSGSSPLSTKTKTWLFPLLGFIAIFLLFAINTMRFASRMLTQHGGVNTSESKPNYSLIFLAILVIAVCVVGMLKMSLEDPSSVMHVLMFTVLPYVAFITFIIGSIYRYRNKGFKVSSLSSQFLEGKKLFWGSQPFHWGILVLFVGHLIAFLFPRAVIAFNGAPVRLLILEVTAFIFGLSALWGIILLIRRRLTTPRVIMVTNKMDMLVYVTLITQIVTGLGVAFFVRWGSSWFAGVLTPYLRSLFAMNPDIEAVSAMPWWVQVHIISAFFIIAIIPFTRFMHFLVAPIDYIWRRYQVVMWNYNRKSIRTSKRYFFGHKPKNH